MESSLTRAFCKTAGCPSSQTLLRYRCQPVPAAEKARIENHLRDCDFCNAELQLLMRFGISPEQYRLAAMPGQLRRLAEPLLATTTTPFMRVAFSRNRQSH